MSHALVLLLALGLDAIFGEPEALWKRFPHPAVLMGRAVGWVDRMMNHGQGRLVTGALAIAALTAAAWLVGALLARIGWPVEVVVATIVVEFLSEERPLSRTFPSAPLNTQSLPIPSA